MDGTFRLIHDAGAYHVVWWPFAVPAGVAALLAVGFVAYRGMPLGWRLLIAAMLLAFAGVAGLIGRREALADQALVDSARAGTCTVIEGRVEGFQTRRELRRRIDSFRVGETRFSYSNFVRGNPGYHRTVDEGGPPLAGRRVRICAKGGQILKLWLEDRD